MQIHIVDPLEFFYWAILKMSPPGQILPDKLEEMPMASDYAHYVELLNLQFVELSSSTTFIEHFYREERGQSVLGRQTPDLQILANSID